MVSVSKIKTVGFYRKVLGYLMDSLFSDSGFSIIAAICLIFLIGMGLNDYLEVSNPPSVIIEQSSVGDFSRIDFNISFPALSCEFASVDANDVSRTVKSFEHNQNFPQVLNKFKFESSGSEFRPGPIVKISKHDKGVDEEDGQGSIILNADNFDRIANQHAILVVKFYVPWCPWSQRLKPSWEETAMIMRERYDPESDGRILLGEVDCTQEEGLCSRHEIVGFPSVRIFRSGSDLIVDDSTKDHYHETYYGDRDKDSLVKAMEDLVAPIPLQSRRTSESSETETKDDTNGPVECRIVGFLLVKMFPSNIIISTRSATGGKRVSIHLKAKVPSNIIVSTRSNTDGTRVFIRLKDKV